MSKNMENVDKQKDFIDENDTNETKLDNTEEETDDENSHINTIDYIFPNLEIDNSNIYTVTMDGIPLCYTKTLEYARKRMWEFARLRKENEIHYNTYIREFKNQDTIEVVGCLKFCVINVDRTIYKFNVCRIQEIVEKNKDENFIDDMYEIKSGNSKSFYSTIFGLK